MTKEILVGYKDTLDRSLESNKESVQPYYDLCKSLIGVLQKQLEDDNLLFEEKKYIIDKLFEVSKMMGEKDSENKKFITTMMIVGATAVGIAPLCEHLR